MSRRTAIVEEFDDDTDLPLPSRPLPDWGVNGPVLEEMHISDDEFEPAQSAGPASPPRPSPVAHPDSNRVTDITPYKKWTCIYPIYIDAKRPYGAGERRIERQKSVWWPLSQDMAEVTKRLGLMALHEVNKAHPRDWDNPGRVRVQWKKDGRFVNPAIRTKKQLLEKISAQIQLLKQESVPKPPYTLAPPKPTTATPSSKVPAGKGKQPASKASKPLVGAGKRSGRRLAVPPEPHAPLANRLSAYSPAVATGVLIETVKAGMSAQESAGVVPGAGAGASGGQKGKRKVVRVRA